MTARHFGRASTLFVNGPTLDADPLDAFAFAEGLRERSELALAYLEAWLREHTRS